MSTLYFGHRDQRYGPTSYAQHGDDFMILNIFDQLRIEKPSYIDLGAHHPETISNTKLLYDRGSRGINVEANPALFGAFLKERPEDINVNVGVGILSGSMTFHMYGETSGRNTFSIDEVEAVKPLGLTVRRKIELPVMTVNEILDKYNKGRWPHFLNCDIEGLDFDILKSLELVGSWAPVLICVETRADATYRMQRMLQEKGYAYHCRMGENLFFIHRDYAGGL
jgi:FkbM family methyltransferase